MRLLATSLATWDTIESGKGQRHALTFPLAILGATLRDAGFPDLDCWEGEDRPTHRDHGALLISAMDSRHFWRIGPFLREYGIAARASERSESDPIVVMGGQAATAPAPVEHLVDVAYIGEAEAHAGDLVRAIANGRAAGWARSRILEACAAVPGCLVPSHLPAGHVVAQVFAEDVGITLREHLNVNLRQIVRVEIARGCASKCGFCALGWRSRYRENDTDEIAAALRRAADAGVREVHLSAGDAEGHSGIVALRQLVRDHGLRDHGWTGRLDTMDDCSVSAGKQFAFGLEGPSWRLRRIAGKPKLTDAYVVDEIDAYWQSGGRRLMWHMIGGLPGEQQADADAFAGLLARVEERVPSGERYHLEIGRQPFGPLPHTPMQWFAPGLSTARIGAVVARHVKGARLAVVDKSGQSITEALINAVMMRGGHEVQRLVDAGPPRLERRDERIARVQAAAWLTRAGLDPRRYYGAWDPDAPTPWDHVRSAHPRESLRRAYARLERMTQE